MEHSGTTRFVKIGADGCLLPFDAPTWEAVFDKTTNLMWSVEIPKVEINYDGAEITVKNIKTAGFQNWQIPTIEQLFLLADRTNTNPVIDTDFFPNIPKNPENWFWSCTTYKDAWNSKYKWVLEFYYGIVGGS